MSTTHLQFMNLAFEQARKSFAEGGVPVGAVLVRGGKVLATGHNQRVQLGDPIAHGEMDCIRKAGRQRTYRDTVLYTTLCPCMMCAGTIVQFKIPHVVIGEDENFSGSIPFLRENGIQVDLLMHQGCLDLMRRFIREKPELWFEDIGDAHESTVPPVR